MKIKLFSAAILLSLVMSGCSLMPSGSASSNNEETSSINDPLDSSNKPTTPEASSINQPKVSSSVTVPDKYKIPAFQPFTNSTNPAPIMESPLDAEGKHPATGQIPEETMSQEFLRLFSYGSKPKIYLNFAPATLKVMSDLQKDRNNRKYYDAYFPANFRLVLDGKAYDYEEVGVRMKGNWSRKEMTDWDGKITKASHLKISFKATFDDDLLYSNSQLAPFKKDWSSIPAERAARKDRNLFGMEKLDLKCTPRNDAQGTGTPENACIGREVYCYDRFRDQNLLAPYANLGTITLNNDISSKTETMELVECVDKAFLKKRYTKKDRKGNLYKCAKNLDGARANFADSVDTQNGKKYAVNINTTNKDAQGFATATRKAKGLIGVEDCYNGYDPTYQLKTNDDYGENADYSDLVNVFAKLYSIVKFNSITSANKLAALNNMIDMDGFLRFSAVSYLMGNVDDQRNAGNNFYLYFVPSTNKMTFIAYDWDWCLGAAYDEKDMTLVNPLDTYVPEGGDENKDLGSSGGGAGGMWGGGAGNTPINEPYTTNDKAYTGYNNNLFWSTILTPKAPKCDTTGSMAYVSGLQKTYLTQVQNLKDDVLDINYFSNNITLNYMNINSSLKLTKEANNVAQYMNYKKNRLDSYFIAHPIAE